MDLKVTVKNNEGRLDRYLKRIGDGRDGRVSYSSTIAGNWLLRPKGEDIRSDAASTAWNEMPVFFETRYFVRCQFDNSVTAARVVHRMASISDSFDFGGGILVGTLDFINAPGKFRFVVEYKRNGVWESVCLEWMVVSEKMDVETDLKRITKVIQKASPSLVHAFLAKTLTTTSVGPAGGKQDDNLWFTLFEKVFDEFRKAVELIVHNPHLKYLPVAEYLRAERVKRWTPSLENRFHGMDPARQAIALFRSERIDPETDTVENRFVLYTLNELSRHLKQFADECERHETVSSDFVNRLREKRSELLKLAANPFFRGVGRFTGFRQESLALQRKPGYARIYADWLILQQSLDPEGAKIEIGYRPISSLYEFWCFLVIRDRIASSHQFKCENPVPKIGSLEGLNDIFDDADEPDNMQSGLNKIAYEFDEVEGGSRKVILTYQQSYNSGVAGAFVYLNPQRPDIVLTIKDTSQPDWAAEEFSYIFDAKYRIRPSNDDSPDATTTEAIDAMHQYRDAILYRKQKGDKHLSREIIGAYVLYPGRSDRSQSYDKVITAENIGAIPLLPAERNDDGSYKTDAQGNHGEKKLNEFIDKLLERSKASEHLGKNASGFSSVIPTRGTTVLVGEAGHKVIIAQNVVGRLTEWVRSTGYFPLPENQCQDPELVKILGALDTLTVKLFRVEECCTNNGAISRDDVIAQYPPTVPLPANVGADIGYGEDVDSFHVWKVQEIDDVNGTVEE